MSDRQETLDRDEKFRQECLGRCKAHINSREHLTDEQKADAVSRAEREHGKHKGQLEKRLAECDRQYYEIKALSAAAWERSDRAVGPVGLVLGEASTLISAASVFMASGWSFRAFL